MLFTSSLRNLSVRYETIDSWHCDAVVEELFCPMALNRILVFEEKREDASEIMS